MHRQRPVDSGLQFGWQLLIRPACLNPSQSNQAQHPGSQTRAGSKCFQAKNDTIRVRAEDDTGPFASAINNEGGATYAFEWRADMVNVWIWMGASAPIEVKNGSIVDPTTWGPPRAQYIGDGQEAGAKYEDIYHLLPSFSPGRLLQIGLLPHRTVLLSVCRQQPVGLPKRLLADQSHKSL